MSYLTETAPYDEPGSWGRCSAGWPEVRGDDAYSMYVFANKAQTSAPYGSYVLMSQAGEYGSRESCLRVHKDHIEVLKAEFVAAGSPSADEVMRRYSSWGGQGYCPRWWV